MGFSTSTSFAVVFLGALVGISLFMGAFLNTAEHLAESQTGLQDQAEVVRDSDFELRQRAYFPTNGTLLIEAENVGQTTVSVEQTDILIDGRLQQSYVSRSVDGSADDTVWAPTTRLQYEFDVTDPSRIVVAGPHGLQRFAYVLYTELVPWVTPTDWDNSLTEDNVVHETFGDRQDDQVQIGYPSFDQDGSALLAYWPMDDSGGSVTDVAGTADATATNVEYDRNGLLNTTSLNFSTNSYLDGINTEPTAQAFTVSAWVKFNNSGAGSNKPIFDDYVADNNDGLKFFINHDSNNHDQPALFIGDGSSTKSVRADGSDTDLNLSTRTWHFVAATYDGETMRVYHNDRLVGTNNVTDGYTPSTNPAYIGTNSDTGSEQFKGRIEDLRVYDRHLPTSQIQGLYGVNSSGFLNTSGKSFSRDYNPADLRVENINATVPSLTGASVYVLSDPDDDGTYEEESDEITLRTGSNQSYEVTGLSAQSKTYALSLELTTEVPEAPLRTPTIDAMDLVVEASASRSTIP